MTYARCDQRAKGEQYVRGLLLEGRRKSIQPMAARLPDGESRGLLGTRHHLVRLHCGAVTPLIPSNDANEVDVEIRWPDIDGYGHVSHMALVAIAEHGRSRWLDALLQIAPTTWPYVVVHLELDFRSPAQFTDRVLRCAYAVERVGTSSVTTRERFAAPSGDVVMEGKCVIAAWDEQRSTARPLTGAEKARLNP